MKKTLLMSAALLMLAAPAFAESVETSVKTDSQNVQKDDGSMEKKDMVESKSKDSAGTEVNEKTTVKVDAKADGEKEKETKTVKTVDPKGLFNEKKTEKTVIEKVKDGKLETHTQEKVDGKTTVDVKEEKPAQ